ncbi:MAG: heme-copper oxidase subunit III [Cyclobacteriaceae bacterium]|nr:heme-copper oxidase subunit III [Cyclobacteriaceae bacterium]
MKDKGTLLAYFIIASEAFFFIALIIGYVYYRNFSDATDTVAKYLDAGRTGIFTIFLIASSFTLIYSKKALFNNRIGQYKLFMGLTILLGIVFMVGQATEYVGLYQEQITLNKDVFGASFFTLTGFHGLHVILGLIALSILYGISFGNYRNVTKAGIGGVDVYWHFVDIVWLFVFFFVYITPLL